VKPKHKLSLHDLPPELVNIILSYIPLSTRLSAFRYKYTEQLLAKTEILLTFGALKKEELRAHLAQIRTLYKIAESVLPVVKIFFTYEKTLMECATQLPKYKAEMKSGEISIQSLWYVQYMSLVIIKKVIEKHIKIYQSPSSAHKVPVLEAKIFHMFKVLLLSLF
jgi:hypothetical protein